MYHKLSSYLFFVAHHTRDDFSFYGYIIINKIIISFNWNRIIIIYFHFFIFYFLLSQKIWKNDKEKDKDKEKEKEKDKDKDKDSKNESNKNESNKNESNKNEKGSEGTGGRWGTKAVAAQKEKAAKKALLKRQFSKNNLPTHISKLSSQTFESSSDSDDVNVNISNQKKRKSLAGKKKVKPVKII